MAKITKGAAYYRKADIPGECCGNCSMFRPRENYANGLCTLVEGVIEPEDTCNFWEAKAGAQFIKVGALLGALLGAWWIAKGPRR